MRSSFSPLYSLCSLCPLWLISVGCHGGAARTAEPHDASAAVESAPVGSPKSFVETVPGSTVTFETRPVPLRNADRTIRVLWFAETETTWDAYDVFYLWLDEYPDGTGVGREG